MASLAAASSRSCRRVAARSRRVAFFESSSRSRFAQRLLAARGTKVLVFALAPNHGQPSRVSKNISIPEKTRFQNDGIRIHAHTGDPRNHPRSPRPSSSDAEAARYDDQSIIASPHKAVPISWWLKSPRRHDTTASTQILRFCRARCLGSGRHMVGLGQGLLWANDESLLARHRILTHSTPP